MSFEVVEEKTNLLMGRREAKLLVHHEGAGTPDRITVRKLASDHFKAHVDQVYVRSIATRTGGSSAVCMVEVYEDRKVAEKVVPAYIKNRNLPKEQRISKRKGEEAKPSPPPAKKPPEAKAPVKAEPAKEAGPMEKQTKPQPKPEPKPKT